MSTPDTIIWHHGITMRYAIVDGYHLTQNTLDGMNDAGEYVASIYVTHPSDNFANEYFWTLDAALTAIRTAKEEGR